MHQLNAKLLSEIGSLIQSYILVYFNHNGKAPPSSQPSHSGRKPLHCSSPPSGLTGHLLPPQQTE